MYTCSLAPESLSFMAHLTVEQCVVVPPHLRVNVVQVPLKALTLQALPQCSPLRYVSVINAMVLQQQRQLTGSQHKLWNQYDHLYCTCIVISTFTAKHEHHPLCRKRPSPPWGCSRPGTRWTCTRPSRPQPRAGRYGACGRRCYCGRASSSVQCEPLWSKAAPPCCLHTATPAGQRCLS